MWSLVSKGALDIKLSSAPFRDDPGHDPDRGVLSEVAHILVAPSFLAVDVLYLPDVIPVGISPHSINSLIIIDLLPDVVLPLTTDRL